EIVICFFRRYTQQTVQLNRAEFGNRPCIKHRPCLQRLGSGLGGSVCIVGIPAFRKVYGGGIQLTQQEFIYFLFGISWHKKPFRVIQRLRRQNQGHSAVFFDEIKVIVRTDKPALRSHHFLLLVG